MHLPIAVLAGGLATRLKPITDSIPKSLVDINGKPFIMHQLDYLRNQGITRIVLCLGYLGEQVEAIIGNGSGLGLDVCYSYDGQDLKGTGGALKKALPFLGEQFFVIYGDSYLPINFTEVKEKFIESKKPALITVLKNDNQWDKSNVLFHDGYIEEYNKKSYRPEMNYIDYGLGILTSSVVDNIRDGSFFDLSDLYHSLSVKGSLAGFEVFERFYEIGSHSGLRETREYFK